MASALARVGLFACALSTGCPKIATSTTTNASPAMIEAPTKTSYAVSVVAPRDSGVIPDFEDGIATFYADMLTGHPTASGELYRPDKSTCAHREYDFDTVLEITNVDTGHKARCRVNDRGPYDEEHLIDVSKKVARQLDMMKPHVADVRVRVADDQSDPDRR